MSEHPLSPVERLHLAFELFEAGRDMMRAKLRREHPDATEEEIERRLAEWVSTRPGAEHGDAVGRVLPWREPEE
jgi:hypothetical protein